MEGCFWEAEIEIVPENWVLSCGVALDSRCQELFTDPIEAVTGAPELLTTMTTGAALPTVVAYSKVVVGAVGCDRSSISGVSW